MTTFMQFSKAPAGLATRKTQKASASGRIDHGRLSREMLYAYN
jgi:hypothetical protein